MHRSHPDVDWKKINQKNRKLNTDKVIELRKALLESKDFQDMLDNYEVIVDRDIEGEWVERGSNNLAGRIRTADIDFTNNNIYCYWLLWYCKKSNQIVK